MICIVVDDILGRASALHSRVCYVELLHASLAAFPPLWAVLAAKILFTCAGYFFLPLGK